MPLSDDYIENVLEIEEGGVDYFLLIFDNENIPDELFVTEGTGWLASGKKDWMFRTDQENQALKQQFHVHVAKAKHINAKTQQVSWNRDGSRRDRYSFNERIGSLKIVQSIAKQALRVPDSFVLESIKSKEQHLKFLSESERDETIPGVFRYVI